MRSASNVPVLDSVADPVRLRILRRLAEEGPATLTELAAAAGVHPNTVRAHVAEVEASGLVVREFAPPHGRGRPAGRFRLAAGWRLPTTDFRGLAQLLVAAVEHAGVSDRELRTVGRQWGRQLMNDALAGEMARKLERENPPVLEHEIPRMLDQEIARVLEQLGFQAQVRGRDVLLSGCACALVSPERPELICQLATSVIEGMAHAVGGRLAPTPRSHDPQRRVCRLQLADRGQSNVRRRARRGAV